MLETGIQLGSIVFKCASEKEITLQRVREVLRCVVKCHTYETKYI